VFVPIGFMGGIVGGFFKQFGLSIAAATLFSLVRFLHRHALLGLALVPTGEVLEAKQGFRAVRAALSAAGGALSAGDPPGVCGIRCSLVLERWR